MKKILLLLCCLFLVSTSYADEKKEVELQVKTVPNKNPRPYSLSRSVVASQQGSIISVFARNSSCLDVSIVNTTRQEEVYHVAYDGNEMLIDLYDCEEGTYIIYIMVNDVVYYGMFIL